MTVIKEANIKEIAEKLGLSVQHNNKTYCPFCGSEKTPALHLYNDHYHCFSCAAHGDAVDLVMAVLHCSFSEAYAFITGEKLPSVKDNGKHLNHEMITFDVPIGTRIEYDPDKNQFVEKPEYKRITGLNKALRYFQDLENKKLEEEITERIKEAFERKNDSNWNDIFFPLLVNMFPKKKNARVGEGLKRRFL